MEKTYNGSCHCGAVKYEAKISEIKPMECNCSICGRLGTMLCFVGEEDFELKSGEKNLKDYLFNKEKIHHLFCEKCGVHPFGWGTDENDVKMYAVNVRCLDGVEPEKLKTTFYDGKSL